MIYQSTLMKSSLIEDLVLTIKNSLTNESVEKLELEPKIQMTYLPKIHPSPPLVVEIELNKNRVNIE
jgi:DNA-directed RNA polymerase subunit H (RpoH/RPB5)